MGQNDSLKIFGDDYDTRDGSCIRDYIHVLDLAQAHVKGMDYLFQETSSSQIFNLGTEKGYTVKEIFKTAEELLNQSHTKLLLAVLGIQLASLQMPQKLNNILIGKLVTL